MSFSYAMGRASLQFVKIHPATFFPGYSSPSCIDRTDERTGTVMVIVGGNGREGSEARVTAAA
jgi:hypothetical protein